MYDLDGGFWNGASLSLKKKGTRTETDLAFWSVILLQRTMSRAPEVVSRRRSRSGGSSSLSSPSPSSSAERSAPAVPQPRAPLQSFLRWSLDPGAYMGSAVNLVGLLHARPADGAHRCKKVHVPDTLILHGGSLAAWFFTSRGKRQLLCKHRSHLTVEHVIKDFARSLELSHLPAPAEKNPSKTGRGRAGMGHAKPRAALASTRATENDKVALLFRGLKEPVAYLSLTELQTYLEHRSVADANTTCMIQKLVPYVSAEFKVLKVTWISGHCVVEGREFAEGCSQFADVRVEERLRALDSFTNELNPIHVLNRGLAYRDVKEAWLGDRLLERLRILCSSIASHVLGVTSAKVKRLVCLFKLGDHNALTYLFPLHVELQPSEPSKALLEAVAQERYEVEEVFAPRLEVRTNNPSARGTAGRPVRGARGRAGDDDEDHNSNAYDDDNDDVDVEGRLESQGPPAVSQKWKRRLEQKKEQAQLRQPRPPPPQPSNNHRRERRAPHRTAKPSAVKQVLKAYVIGPASSKRMRSWLRSRNRPQPQTDSLLQVPAPKPPQAQSSPHPFLSKERARQPPSMVDRLLLDPPRREPSTPGASAGASTSSVGASSVELVDVHGLSLSAAEDELLRQVIPGHSPSPSPLS